MKRISAFCMAIGFVFVSSKEAMAVYNKPAPLPSDTTSRYTTCPLSESTEGKYRVIGNRKYEYMFEDQIAYREFGWENKMHASLNSLNRMLDKNLVYASVIDVRRINGKLSFLYLSNGTQNVAFQPWSSSKFLASLSAMRMMRKAGVGAHSKVNGMHFGDIVTAAHTGLPSGRAHGRSNVHGTWLQNIAGRFNSNWLIRNWLKRERETFLGGYSRNVPSGDAIFHHITSGNSKKVYHGPQGASRTRLSTLTLAEALRRVAVHEDASPAVKFPLVDKEDIRVLFYGNPNRTKAGGMLAANGNYYRDALGGVENLNRKTRGQWRIFTKTGSADRKTGQQQLVNGIICLPNYKGGRLIIASIFAKGPVGKLGDVRLKGAIKKTMDLLVPGF